MDCTNPNFISSVGFVACGRCPNCLINKKKEWSDRLQIELRYWQYKYFVTLTYRDEDLPKDGSLKKSDLKGFLKRLGYYCGGVPQYFACGEYGDISQRPHYHLILMSDKDIFDAIMDSWSYGRIDIQHTTPGRCKYVTGYVVKKMTKADDERLYGRTPEFRSSSRRPPLGYRFECDFVGRMLDDEGFRSAMLAHLYPPVSIKLNGASIRIPTFVRRILAPLYRFYADQDENEEIYKQRAAWSQERKNASFAILKQIAQNVQSMSMKWDDIKLITMDERKRREKQQLKGYKIRQRRNI